MQPGPESNRLPQQERKDVRMRRLIAVAALAGAVAACDVGTTEIGPLYFEWQGQLEFEPDFEPAQGVAAFGWNEGENQITALVDVTGDEPGEVRSWDLRQGTCDTGGEILGSAGDYPALEIEPNGAGQVVTEVPVGVDDVEGAYHIAILLDDDETRVACANLVLAIVI